LIANRLYGFVHQMFPVVNGDDNRKQGQIFVLGGSGNQNGISQKKKG